MRHRCSDFQTNNERVVFEIVENSDNFVVTVREFVAQAEFVFLSHIRYRLSLAKLDQMPRGIESEVGVVEVFRVTLLATLRVGDNSELRVVRDAERYNMVFLERFPAFITGSCSCALQSQRRIVSISFT